MSAQSDPSVQLLQRYVPAVRVFARRRLRNREAVDEFTQDVMLIFFDALRQGIVEQPGGFVLGICRNLARERARLGERRQQLWQQFGSALDMTAACERDPHVMSHLEDCFSQLTRRARDVLRLAFVTEHDNTEIAAEMKLTDGNVRIIRHRSLSELRECMSRRISWEAA